MAATKYYPQGNYPAELPTSEQSAAFPAAAATTIGSPGNSGLSTSPSVSKQLGETTTFTTNATLTQQSGLSGMAGIQVGSGTIGNGTWRIAAYGDESNGSANGFVGASIYVYRVGSGVVGYIYDTLATLGAEVDGAYNISSLTGTGVAASNGDYVVIELYWLATQAMNTGYTGTGPRVSWVSVTPSDATEGSAINASSGWIEAPDAFPAYVATKAPPPFGARYRPHFTTPRRRYR